MKKSSFTMSGPRVNRLFENPQEHTRDGHERVESEHLLSPGAVGDRLDISLLKREGTRDKPIRADSNDEDDVPPSKKLRKDQEILDKREEVHKLEGVILARDREILRLKEINQDLRAEVREKDNALKRKDSKLRTPEITKDDVDHFDLRALYQTLKHENMALLRDRELCQAAKGKSELRVNEPEAQINTCKERVAELKRRWDKLKDLEDSRDDDVFTEPRTSYEEYEMRELVDCSFFTLVDIIGGLEKPNGVGVDRRDKDVISMDEDCGDDM